MIPTKSINQRAARAFEARLTAEDAETYVPGSVLPVIRLPLPLQAPPAVFPATTNQTESFYFGTALINRTPGSGPLNTDLCAFTKGLWRVTVGLASVIDVAVAASYNNNLWVYLQSPPGAITTMKMLQGYYSTVANRREATWDLLLTDDGWRLEVEDVGTPASMSLSYTVDVLALKLLSS